MKTHPHSAHRPGFTLMEILVVIAIIVVLAAIAFPVYSRIKANNNKVAATNIMRQLGAAIGTYATSNNGDLPKEDAKGQDDWAVTATPEADKAWYNALPRVMGQKGVGDYVKEGREVEFYSPKSVLYLPGAQYPEGKRMSRPYFAIAINGRLQRKDKDGKKRDLRMGSITMPARTVIFVEQGLPGETKAHETISKNDYDGAPKGNAKSFVARYGNRGIIAFLDGHAEEVSAKDLLTPTGDMIWSAEQATTDPSAILWAADPKEDPNSAANE